MDKFIFGKSTLEIHKSISEAYLGGIYADISILSEIFFGRIHKSVFSRIIKKKKDQVSLGDF